MSTIVRLTRIEYVIYNILHSINRFAIKYSGFSYLNYLCRRKREKHANVYTVTDTNIIHIHVTLRFFDV